jgi:alcohol dehydrogenase class IV
MVADFQFSKLPLIYFGPGKIKLLTDSIKRFGNNIILVSRQDPDEVSTLKHGLFDFFNDSGISWHNVIIKGEPSPESVDDVVVSMTDNEIDAVVGIGGGSVLDAGKAISAMLPINGSVTDYLEGVGTLNHPGTKLPYIAVPTTSGTGSEATKNAVISRIGKDGFKRSLRHENFVPDIAIIDPLLTISCPPGITAASGMDCFSQLIEAFLSSKACEYTDALAFEGLKAVKSSLLQCYSDGTNVEARSGMSFAALTSGICLANAGLGAVHGFASSIGGMYEIPHGIICGTLMAEANAVNVRQLRKRADNPLSMRKYSSLGRLFTGETGKSDDYYIEAFIGYLNALTQDLKLPLLGSLGINRNDIRTICENTEIKNNPVGLSLDDLMEIISGRFKE